MKVLYVGHYKEASGWGQVARDNILALDSVGVEVIPRAFLLGNPTNNLPQRIVELEQQSSQNCDIIIQHVLPHYMKYDSRFKKNIGIFETETMDWDYTSWPGHLNLMDELWVPCEEVANACLGCDVTSPIFTVPHTFNTLEYQKEYPKLNLPVDNRFTFYFIGEMNQRKHLSALIQAFHIEFGSQEPVELVIKVNKFGMSPEQLAQELKNFCNSIKDGLRLYKDPQRYKSEIIITINVSREDLLRLHQTCDCFVLPSYGEAWGIPAFEAMAMGNIVLASRTGAMKDYIVDNITGYLVDGSMEPVFGQKETFEEFGTAREKWFNISLTDLMAKMRAVYELSPASKDAISTNAKIQAQKYDYKIVGKTMKELLNA